MRDPESTKSLILEKAGELFNTQGYKATSISDITSTCSLTKGAIYRHFGSKENLETETLKHLTKKMSSLIRIRIKAEKTAGAKMRAIFEYFGSYITDPPIKGGCPIMNVSVEADDSYPHLREEAERIHQVLIESVVKIVENGKRYGQINSGTDALSFATLTVAALEGAIMMSKLKNRYEDFSLVIKQLEELLVKIEI